MVEGDVEPPPHAPFLLACCPQPCLASTHPCVWSSPGFPQHLCSQPSSASLASPRTSACVSVSAAAAPRGGGVVSHQSAATRVLSPGRERGRKLGTTPDRLGSSLGGEKPQHPAVRSRRGRGVDREDHTHTHKHTRTHKHGGRRAHTHGGRERETELMAVQTDSQMGETWGGRPIKMVTGAGYRDTKIERRFGRDRKEEEKWKQVWQQTRGPLKTRKCHPPWSHSPVTVSDALCVLSATRSS